MKSLVLFILSLFLLTAILAPMIISMANSIENKVLVIDFNDEEQKEEKKETNEKDFFLDSNLKLLTHLRPKNTSILSFYVESEYSTSIAIFLPPPKHIF